MHAQQMLITGAAAGIGATIAAKAAAQGHRVIAADMNGPALLDRWKGTPDVRCEVLDVTQPESWNSLVAKLDREGIVIDVLMNVAGVLRSGQTGELAQRDIDLTIDVNVKGVIYGSNAVASGMRQRRRGHIINVGSLASLIATPGNTLYTASKFAVRGFSIASAGDLAPYGVAVTLVGPGPVKTAMLEQQRGDPNAALTFAASRALTPDEVADAILGRVLKKRPIECFLPFRDGITGKIANAFPWVLLRRVERARKKGQRNFKDPSFEKE